MAFPKGLLTELQGKIKKETIEDNNLTTKMKDDKPKKINQERIAKMNELLVESFAHVKNNGTPLTPEEKFKDVEIPRLTHPTKTRPILAWRH